MLNTHHSLSECVLFLQKQPPPWFLCWLRLHQEVWLRKFSYYAFKDLTSQLVATLVQIHICWQSPSSFVIVITYSLPVHFAHFLSLSREILFPPGRAWQLCDSTANVWNWPGRTCLLWSDCCLMCHSFVRACSALHIGKWWQLGWKSGMGSACWWIAWPFVVTFLFDPTQHFWTVANNWFSLCVYVEWHHKTCTVHHCKELFA